MRFAPGSDAEVLSETIAHARNVVNPWRDASISGVGNRRWTSSTTDRQRIAWMTRNIVLNSSSEIV
jgi:hypothetical protein